MADISRQSSPRIAPISASPSRPSPLSRPHWPYTTYSHRSSSSATSIHSTSSLTGWDPRASTSSPSTLTSQIAGTPGRRHSGLSLAQAQEDNMRHWSFTAFEWIVRDVRKLRDYVESTGTGSPSEGSNSADNENFDILKDSPTLGDGKFKLEIAKCAGVDNTESEAVAPVIRIQTPPSLSLYITSLMLDYAHADYEMYTSMFTGIKCQDDRVGERGARAEWVWEYWQNDWIFREDSEVWECPLPPLSTLLENPRIKETDSFVICVQVHSPVGPFFPQQPSAAYVPRDLLDGLEASLDNANTGDVQFICLERKDDTMDENHDVDATPDSPSTEVPTDRRSSSVSTMSLPSSHTTARKRVIYAHSDILKRRSDYFATMLNSSFSENTAENKPTGERKVYTIMVEEADFCTIYWLLKWVYANWTLFREHDDPKAAVDGVGAGWSARSLKSAGGADEWEWRTFSKHHDSSQDLSGISDARSIASLESAHSSSQKAKAKAKPTIPASPSNALSTMRSTGNTSALRQPPSPSKSTSTRPSSSPTRRASTNALGNQLNLTVPSPPSPTPSPSSPRSKAATLPISPTAGSFPLAAGSHHPLSPRQQRQPRSRPSSTAVPDPHPHPAPAPPPASALSMYQVAHRYDMPGLASLAMEHMMSTITPQGSFALLLATSAWDELHVLIEDYVVEKWDEVSVSSEFEQCCQEVAGGEWGPEGGKTMTALFRRLRSPNSLSFRT
ncbi:hypothetical protein EIP91_005961 [Steccherinum ochraceum]|uniref:BTB domain-containing protein n=1 Tax=Steccherinum ochraceum TaxID=92696 RepID=A0A4R0S1C4_9APHY|nr:hypothetical protein EIP91_005961 [Steccherinum ochraceum]